MPAGDARRYKRANIDIRKQLMEASAVPLTKAHLMLANDDTVADRINKAFLDSLRLVIDYQQEEIIGHQRMPGRDLQQLQQDLRHAYFTNVLLDCLEVLRAADKRVHPSVPRSPARKTFAPKGTSYSVAESKGEQHNRSVGADSDSNEGTMKNLTQRMCSLQFAVATLEEILKALQAANTARERQDVESYSPEMHTARCSLLVPVEVYNRCVDPSLTKLTNLKDGKFSEFDLGIYRGAAGVIEYGDPISTSDSSQLCWNPIPGPEADCCLL
ncbi:hypothetical protein E8E11_001610 [Didymella keratinophila]|nr:hypothetical protein E8E11_001610 [Didymella keratinophila]